MGKVNPWLEQKLKKLQSPQVISLIVEVEDPGRLQEVRSRISVIPGASVGQTSFNMIQVTAPPESVSVISAIPGVVVHYNAPVGIPLKVADPLMGEFRLSAVEVPYTRQEMAARLGSTLALGLAALPLGILKGFTGLKTRLTEIKQAGVIIMTTGDILELLDLPINRKTTHTKVAVLDTGLVYPHPLLHPTKGIVQLGTTVGFSPLDELGHGTWITTAGFGDNFVTRFGLCRGVADPENSTLGSWKVLSGQGFGTSFSTIRGIEAAHKWGARLINMSLEAELQGSVEDDPLCRIIKQLKDEVIFVVPCGNGGPGEWTIGSPGASPYAVTVGAYSVFYDGLAYFSSRGPNGAWYAQNGGRNHRDFATYGGDLVKPDILAPGGGPVREGDAMDLLYSGIVGWLDGMYDLTLDGFGALRGTSMACPIAAGVIALAVENGLVHTAKDVKLKMARHRRKDSSVGYGGITYTKLL